MARVNIILPEQFLAVFYIPVRITDINYGNHTGNHAFIEILHEARMQWLRQYGYTELDAAGIGLIMSDLAIEFSKESFYGDIIEVKIGAGEAGRAGFELFYLLQTQRNKITIILAKAKTGMVCYDYGTKKVVSVPEKLKALLSH